MELISCTTWGFLKWLDLPFSGNSQELSTFSYGDDQSCLPLHKTSQIFPDIHFPHLEVLLMRVKKERTIATERLVLSTIFVKAYSYQFALQKSLNLLQ